MSDIGLNFFGLEPENQVVTGRFRRNKEAALSPSTGRTQQSAEALRRRNKRPASLSSQDNPIEAA